MFRWGKTHIYDEKKILNQQLGISQFYPNSDCWKFQKMFNTLDIGASLVPSQTGLGGFVHLLVVRAPEGVVLDQRIRLF